MRVTSPSALVELAAGAGIGVTFGLSALCFDHGSFWIALFFWVWGAALTLLVALSR